MDEKIMNENYDWMAGALKQMQLWGRLRLMFDGFGKELKKSN